VTIPAIPRGDDFADGIAEFSFQTVSLRFSVSNPLEAFITFEH